MANAGEVKVVFAADTAQYSASIQKVRAQTAEFQAVSTRAAHATIQPWQASSAAIRVLEGNITNNIRAAERFVASIGPLRNALMTAFPVIGGVALIGVFGRLATELTKSIELAHKLPRELQQGFASMANSALMANDELRKSNDQLDNQIAKLEGRPQNNLAVALDEARIAADKLEQSLAADNEKMATLMSQKAIGFFEGLKSGQYQTGPTTEKIEGFNQTLADRAHDFNMAVHDFGADSSQAKEAQAAIEAVRADAQKWVAIRIAEVRTWKDVKGTTANLDILQGFRAMLDYQQDAVGLNAQHLQKQTTVDTLLHAKDLEEFRKKQLAEATKLSNEIAAQRKAYDEQAAEYGRTPGLIAPIPLLNAKGEQGPAPIGAPFHVEDLSKGNIQGVQEASRTLTEYLKHLNDGVTIEQRNAQAIAEASLQMEIATGRLSRYDAAQLQAQMHAQEFAEAMRKLDEAQHAIDAAGWMSEAEKQEALAKIANERSQMRGEYGITQLQDNAAIHSATALGTFSDELNRATVRLEDWSAKGAQLFEETLGRVNDEIIHAMTTRDYTKGREFSNIGADFFRGVMGIGLEKLEGDLMKALGFGGKPDGSTGKPFHVIVDKASQAGSAPSGILSKVLGWFGMGGSSIADMGAGAMGSLGAGTLPSIFAPSIDTAGMAATLPAFPAFGDGGAMSANMPGIVGDKGPELWVPDTAGHIVPNHQLLRGGEMHIHVDARGATDPAQIHAAVHRAVREAAPQIVAASVSAVQDGRLRRPSTVR